MDAPSDPPTSRQRLLDAALAVLGRSGERGLTHRAVEERAGLPHGSTRHHFGSSEGLLDAVLEHLIAEDVRATRRTPGPGTPDDPIDALERLLDDWLETDRERLLARYELFLAAGRRPELQPRLRAAGAVFWTLAEPLVGRPQDARAFVAMLDGLLLDQLARGRTAREELRRALELLLRAVA